MTSYQFWELIEQAASFALVVAVIAVILMLTKRR